MSFGQFPLKVFRQKPGRFMCGYVANSLLERIFNVTQDENDRFRFNVYEEFEDKPSFEQHQSRVRSSKWGKITKNVERNYVVEDGASN